MKCPKEAAAGRVCIEEVSTLVSTLVSTQHWAGALACRDSTGGWDADLYPKLELKLARKIPYFGGFYAEKIGPRVSF